MQRYRKPFPFLGLLLFLVFFGSQARAFVVNVDSNTTPWQIPINLSFNFGTGSPVPPAIVSNADVPFVPGDHVLIQATGAVSAHPPDFPLVDPNGVVVMPGNDPTAYFGPVNNTAGSSGNGFPSKYMGPYPPDINLMELVGTFADSTGVIVGTPFFVGASRVVTVPTGATRLQLGINDDVYGDNGGSFSADVTIVPEPGTVWLLLPALGALALKRHATRSLRPRARTACI